MNNPALIIKVISNSMNHPERVNNMNLNKDIKGHIGPKDKIKLKNLHNTI